MGDPPQDALALAALAPRSAHDLALATIRLGKRMASNPEAADQDVMDTFLQAKNLPLNQGDLELLTNKGASDGLIRSVQEVLNEREGPRLP